MVDKLAALPFKRDDNLTDWGWANLATGHSPLLMKWLQFDPSQLWVTCAV